jgi:hypothetical protein
MMRQFRDIGGRKEGRKKMANEEKHDETEEGKRGVEKEEEGRRKRKGEKGRCQEYDLFCLYS